MQDLIKALQDGGFHSGESLGRLLGVSRTAVWKQLQRLVHDYGLPLQSVPGKGYRLAAPLRLLDEARLAMALDCPVCVLEVIDSTNSEAARRLGSGMLPPFTLLAECQTAGRGRRGRSWSSPYGQNLYFSHVLAVARPRLLEGLSLVVGLAICRVLRQLGVDSAALKWPNDVLASGSKIAGVLIELFGDPADGCCAVIGLGVNVDMPCAAGPIDQPWTSIRQETGRSVDRNDLAVALHRELADCIGVLGELGFPAFKAQWESLHAWQGRRVALSTAADCTVGIARGVDARGALCLEVAGSLQRFSGGELSLRLDDDT